MSKISRIPICIFFFVITFGTLPQIVLAQFDIDVLRYRQEQIRKFDEAREAKERKNFNENLVTGWVKDGKFVPEGTPGAYAYYGLTGADHAPQMKLGENSQTNEAAESSRDTNIDIGDTLRRAKLGDVEAQVLMGIAFSEGKGMPIDYKQGAYWYTKAAEQGQVDAQYILGGFYYGGVGVPENHVYSYAWFSLAALQGDTEALAWLRHVASGLSPAQTEQAQEFAAGIRSQINTLHATAESSGVHETDQSFTAGVDTGRESSDRGDQQINETPATNMHASADEAEKAETNWIFYVVGLLLIIFLGFIIYDRLDLKNIKFEKTARSVNERAEKIQKQETKGAGIQSRSVHQGNQTAHTKGANVSGKKPGITTMNQNQRIILVIAIIIIIGMLLYPPFQAFSKNGVVFNMGYSWIMDPPEKGYVTATVNVAMLLIQWIGVLIIAGMSFFLARGEYFESEDLKSNHGRLDPKYMFGVLRIIRGTCGFLFALQIIGLFPIITWISQPSAITDDMLVTSAIKILAMALFGWLFFAFRNIINNLHIKKFGNAHPVFIESKWAL